MKKTIQLVSCSALPLRRSLHSNSAVSFGLYLTGDCERVAQLSLPRPKLSKHLCDGACFNPPCRVNTQSN